MNIQASIDWRSYHYAGLACNAAPWFKAPWEGLMFKFLTKSQIIFFMFPAACSFLNKVHIFLWYSVEGLPSSPWKSHFFLLSPFCPYDTWNLKNKINAPLHRALTWISAETIIVCYRIKENCEERLVSINEKIMNKQTKLVDSGQVNCAFRAR